MTRRVVHPRWPPRSAVAPPVGSVAAFTTFLVPFLVWSLLNPDREGDTVALVNGVDAARACLSHGQYAGCSATMFFPPFQYIPAVLARALGISSAGTVHVLAAISTLAFPALLAVAWSAVRSRVERDIALIVVAMLAAGPLLWYARASFGELFAAFLILVFIEAVLVRRSSVWIAVTFWLAAITKETAFPFLLLLGSVALIGHEPIRDAVRAQRARLLAFVAGTGAALVTIGGFNLFRFDSVRNAFLFQPVFRTPGVARKIDFMVALWLSPNGGLIFFWTLATVGLAAVGVAALHEHPRRRRWPMLAIAAITAALTAGLASWFSPFGWFAWGPRLMLPWIPSLLVLAVALYPNAFRPVVGWFPRVPRLLVGAALGATAAGLALPSVAGAFPPNPLVPLFAPDALCPAPVVVQTSPTAYFYGCETHQAWEKTPVWVNSLHALAGTTALAFAVLLVAAFTVAGAIAWRENGRERVQSRSDRSHQAREAARGLARLGE